MTQCYLPVEDTSKVLCDNCGWEGVGSELDMVTDIEERIDPGGVVPAGQCPECSALAYLVDPPDWTKDPVRDAAPEMLAALEGLFEHCAMIHKHWGEGSNQREADQAQERARAAIAKAKGVKEPCTANP